MLALVAALHIFCSTWTGRRRGSAPPLHFLPWLPGAASAARTGAASARRETAAFANECAMRSCVHERRVLRRSRSCPVNLCELCGASAPSARALPDEPLRVSRTVTVGRAWRCVAEAAYMRLLASATSIGRSPTLAGHVFQRARALLIPCPPAPSLAHPFFTGRC